VDQVIEETVGRKKIRSCSQKGTVWRTD